MVPSTIEAGRPLSGRSAPPMRARRPGVTHPGRSARSTTRSCSDQTCAASQAGVGQPVQLVGHRRRLVVALGARRHRIAGVERDHHVAQDEAAAGPQRRRRPGRRESAFSVPRGGGPPARRRRGRRARRAAGRPGRPRGSSTGSPARRSRRDPQHAFVLVDPDRGRAGVPVQHGAASSCPSRCRGRAAWPRAAVRRPRWRRPPPPAGAGRRARRSASARRRCRGRTRTCSSARAAPPFGSRPSATRRPTGPVSPG